MKTKSYNVKSWATIAIALGALSIFSLNSIAAPSSASSDDVQIDNKIVWEGQAVDRSLHSDGVAFRVVSKNVLADWSILSIFQAADTGLVLGFPRGLIGERNVFGGVVRAVSDPENEVLGGLKLADITPVHVTTFLSSDNEQLILRGCAMFCNELSEQVDLFSIPIVKTDAEYVYLDLKAFGGTLEFLQQMGDFSLPAVKTEVTGFDFSLNTLVFDVVNFYEVPLPDQIAPLAFNMTTRWYLKLSSGLSSGFEARKPTPEVGYFTTERTTNTLIKRFALDNGKPYVTKYYVKNVPEKYKVAFADSFEDWNTQLKSVVGKKFFEYEFIDANDPRSQEILLGDIRYNVLEWDLVNLAGYGGLGPSYASQHTGEIFSANVNVQGPTIEKLYTKWWRVSSTIKMLEQQGLHSQALTLKADYAKEMAELQKKSKPAGLVIGPLAFTIHSADPVLADPALDPYDFFETPVGFDFDTYMYGYFRDMVAHELGHNIGLRHNFKGSLGANGQLVSRSIMEYLDRETRHLDRVGEYDVMAIAYGYRGSKPTRSDWFCTDDDQPSSDLYLYSAECNSSDRSADPFTMLLERLQKLADFVLLPGSDLSPVWNVEILTPHIEPTVKSLANYYVSSFTNASTWTNFYNENRKVSPQQAPDYILAEISAKICNPELDRIADSKTEEGKVIAKKNLADLRDMVQSLTAAYVLPRAGFTKLNFPCFK